ncbi:Transmembrane channel-like protein 7 [Chionoecetes opilio]|uniref:Transmembrane channel-like protein 7 n=1 Tax=Chionoecetes opilio TaxID=41210 RepID=A0A8J4YNR0_CHIOP|nr:Transmembrane channel-like protein 7 [Chionoecetes opilio]
MNMGLVQEEIRKEEEEEEEEEEEGSIGCHVRGTTEVSTEATAPLPLQTLSHHNGAKGTTKVTSLHAITWREHQLTTPDTIHDGPVERMSLLKSYTAPRRDTRREEDKSGDTHTLNNHMDMLTGGNNRGTDRMAKAHSISVTIHHRPGQDGRPICSIWIKATHQPDERESDLLDQRNESGISSGRRDGHSRLQDVRDGRVEEPFQYDHREEHRGHNRESFEASTPGYDEAQEGEHRGSRQQHYRGDTQHEPPLGYQSEPPRSSSGWEENIQNMLPSQVDIHKGTLRFRGSLRDRRTSRASHDPARNTPDPQDELRTEGEVLEALNSLRDQPWSLDRRRETKKRLNAKLANTEVKWYSTRPVAEAMRKSKYSVAKVIQANYIWHDVFKRIEGKFGSSVFAFFNFLRAMIQLNLVLSLVLVGGVVVPSALLAGAPDLQACGWKAVDNSSGDHDTCLDLTLVTNDTKLKGCNLNYTQSLVKDHEGNVIKLVQDFLQGTGFLEWTILFSGRYPASAGDNSYLISLAYLLSVFTAHLISFIFVLYFVAKFFRQLPARVREKSSTLSSVIFTGWDYTVREAKAASTVHICITGEVRTAFDDEQFLHRKLRRTKREYVTLILTRTSINVLVVALIIGGWTGIYFLVNVSQKNIDGGSTQMFVWEYAPTVIVEAINFLYPMFFTFVVPYEQYRGHTELLVTLIRCVLVRLTSLFVLMFTKVIVISQETRSCDPTDPYICWETDLGKQIYSVFILGFIVQVGMTFVVDVAWKALGRLDNPLLKKLARNEFFVPGHVLDVIYLQSICWLSIIHAPIVAIACSLYFCMLFGFKLFTVSYTCVPATRVFHASRSSAMFMTILCLAFLLCLVPNGMVLLYLRPSLSCSPFRGLDYSWQVLTYYVCRMSGSTYWLRWLVFSVDETVVVVAVGVAALLLLVYYLSLVNIRNALIRRLEKKLKHTAKDKVFLMSKYTQQELASRH